MVKFLLGESSSGRACSTDLTGTDANSKFSSLWSHYPTERSPCDGPWLNQCAIRMSITLNAEGALQVSSATYTEPKCSYGHARGAESLANWLYRRQRLGRPTHTYTDSAAAKRELASKTGIIFFKDCFVRGSESFEDRVGDHIDLWNKGRAKTYDDPSNNSKQVWFWELA
jgi:Type VI secretion system (T6SS), amidase effector protein 4